MLTDKQIQEEQDRCESFVKPFEANLTWQGTDDPDGDETVPALVILRVRDAQELEDLANGNYEVRLRWIGPTEIKTGQ